MVEILSDDPAFLTFHCETWSELGEALRAMAADLNDRVIPAHEVPCDGVRFDVWAGVTVETRDLDEQMEQLGKQEWYRRFVAQQQRVAARVRIVPFAVADEDGVEITSF